MVHAKQIEERKLVKRDKTNDGNFSNDKSEGQDSSNTPRLDKEKGTGSPFPKSTYSKCGRSHCGCNTPEV